MKGEKNVVETKKWNIPYPSFRKKCCLAKNMEYFIYHSPGKKNSLAGAEHCGGLFTCRDKSFLETLWEFSPLGFVWWC